MVDSYSTSLQPDEASDIINLGDYSVSGGGGTVNENEKSLLSSDIDTPGLVYLVTQSASVDVNITVGVTIDKLTVENVKSVPHGAEIAIYTDVEAQFITENNITGTDDFKWSTSESVGEIFFDEDVPEGTDVREDVGHIFEPQIEIIDSNDPDTYVDGFQSVLMQLEINPYLEFDSTDSDLNFDVEGNELDVHVDMGDTMLFSGGRIP